ncbi:cytochrome P450 4A25-like isoform X1 [Patiria miniata]|uniref:Cytochrome P450 n=1 Tax=Patiria miniata TaxID=46514 RepID=A0A914AWB5_PATMI|nr:cytochrome P450 4A25-like isoform X1 [Patiria miniata]
MAELASILSLGLVAALTYAVCVLVRYVQSKRRIRGILIKHWPGLPDHWLYGNLHQNPMRDPKIRAAGSEEGLRVWREMTVKFPRGYRWFHGALGMGVVANHPDIMRAVMKGSDPKPFLKFMPSYSFLLPWLGYGLLLASGDTWFRNRRLITHAFHFEILKTYMTIYNKATDILLNKMSECAASGESFVVTKNVSLCTLDILLKCACSYESGCQISGDSHPYVTAVNAIILANRDRVFTPYLYPDFIFQRSSVGKIFAKNVEFVHQISAEVIKKRRDKLREKETDPEPAKSKDQPQDFLGILLAARDEDGKGLTDLEIRNEVDTFLFEGHDTTASSLTWMLYAMATNPEHQRKVQEEIDEVMEGRESEVIQWEDLGKFNYLILCLKEAMRLYPPVPLIQRIVAEKDIMVHDRLIPKGAMVDLNIYALHHNPEIWPNSMEFIPDRFAPENAVDIDPFAYVPFSAGPRNCIGQNFALNEEKVILARVLRRFHIELDPDHKVVARLQLVYKATNDIKLKLKPRF